MVWLSAGLLLIQSVFVMVKLLECPFITAADQSIIVDQLINHSGAFTVDITANDTETQSDSTTYNTIVVMVSAWRPGYFPEHDTDC